MKKLILILALACIGTGLFFQPGLAYEVISAENALSMISENPAVIVVDVRSNIDYCYSGHIPCALNLDWNSGEYESKYQQLPLNVPILNICEHGFRGARASNFLDQHGYSQVYNISGGMSVWPYEKITCKDENPDDCIRQNHKIYFPHIASGNGWETEIAIINTSAETSLSGSIRAYNETGEQVGDSHSINLPPAGRTEMKIGPTFTKPESIRYLIFSGSSDKIYACLKFYDNPGHHFRVAIPAPKTINQKDIIISHITMINGWWTGLSLVNTTTENKTLTFTFNTKETVNLTLPALAHKAVNLADFLKGRQLDEIDSAIISNTEGVIGLEIFGNGKQLGGILLRDTTTKNLYYPHIADDQSWWTGLVAYNPGDSAGQLIIKPYTAAGTLLSPPAPATPTEMVMLSPSAAATPIEIGAKKRYIGATSELDLPEGTKWMAIESSVPVSGFELFGTTNGLQLAGYTSVGIDSLSGVFPKYVPHKDWTGVALINTTSEPISITLTAYSDAGKEVDHKTLPLNGFEQILAAPQKIFDNNIDTATYIAYKATAPVVAFQINSEGEMLDALPGR